MVNSKDEDEPKSKSTVERIVVNTPNSHSVIPTPHFKPQVETFEFFLERLSIYFEVSQVPDKSKVNQLCLILGAEKYKLLRETISPKTLQQVTYKDRSQQKGESLSDYIFVIKSLSLTCKFGAFLDNALRDRLVSGLENKVMVKKLLLEDEHLTFESANVNAVGHVNSRRGRAAIPGGRRRYRQQQHRSVSPKRQSSRSHTRYQPGASNKKFCKACSIKHKPEKCPSKAWACFECQLRGHTARFCPTVDSVMTVINNNPCLSISGVADLGPLTKKLYINKVPTMLSYQVINCHLIWVNF
ncbi:hypothetical protein ILUMI_25442 [Ignelater luminosus]|uniref:CCHC-type domain-containing protein n=1 Tax=Ignelater luminosus TaxID=2038154 RepID=A0A8K0C4S9_IGNLU|nr:hypothetical protein ILUMI_25442 [Ignelater luminosus]